MSITEIKGFGKQLGHTELYRRSEYAVDFLPKIKLEAVCKDKQQKLVIETIVEANKSTKIGTGKITVTTLDQVIQIRTGEINQDAI